MYSTFDRVAYFITRSDAVGGAAVHVKDLALALDRDGIETCVLAGGDGMYLDILRNVGIRAISVPQLVRELNPWRDGQAVLALRHTLSDVKPTILSTHSSKAGIIGRVVAKSLGIPCLFTAHGWSFTDGVGRGRAAMYRRLERFAARAGDHIVAVSEYDYRLALRSGITSEGGISLVRNAMPDIEPSLRARPGESPPQLVMIGRFEEQKDQSALVSAMAGLKELGWKLGFVGDGPTLPRVMDQVSSAGLEDRVTFYGYRSNPSAVLAEAQIFVLTTKWEGLPRSIIEAMRAGLPVVASNVGGVGEMVDDGETGFLVPRGGDEVLRERLRVLIEDVALRERFGHAGRVRYEQRFSFTRMYRETRGVYELVLGRPLRARPAVLSARN